MSVVCLVDTSIFVEVLNVPHMAHHHNQTLQALEEKIRANESLFLPMATILETGNHIAQNGDGNLRRKSAERFVAEVQKAIDGASPFKPVSFITAEELKMWLAEFPDMAMRGCGLGDLSIIHDWSRLCSQNAGRRVYIWSLDAHLGSYDRPSTI
ncbi:MAG: hypothetical protein HQK60_02065 [Deltaproteobacteria bacterium]|nr:hypothetical protein [Deltaproteobacteria bacterium]